MHFCGSVIARTGLQNKFKFIQIFAHNAWDFLTKIKKSDRLEHLQNTKI